MTNPLLEAAERASRTAEALRGADQLYVTAAAEVVRASVDRQIGVDIPRRLVAGARISVAVKPIPGGRSLVSAEGPMHLENNPTKGHIELPRSVGRNTTGHNTKANRRAAKERLLNALFLGEGGFAGATPLRTPYGPRYRVNHPGTRGKKTWQHGVDLARPLIHTQLETSGAALIRSLL